jgi:hypothetical protein
VNKRGWPYRIIYPALLGLGVAALASCAPEKPKSPPPAAAIQPAPPAPPPPPRWRSPPPVPRPQEKPAPLSAAGVGEPSLRPRDLIGLGKEAAAQLFGAADRQIDRPPATVWRYRAQGCALDLYFYLDLESGRMRTLRYAFQGLDGGVGSREACLTTILQRNNAPTANAAYPSR